MAGAPPAAPEGAGGGTDQEGGGVTEVLVETDANLAGLAKTMAGNPQIPDEVKALFAQASDLYRQGMQALSDVAGGGGGPGGAATPEQGASGAVPMSPAGVKRG